MANLPPGTLKVLMHSAKNLASLVTLGEQQPYYIIECGFQKIRSKPCLESGTNPVWKTAHKFELIRETAISITIKDEITKGVIGEADVDLREARTVGREDIAVYLQTLGGKQQGILNLKLRFSPADGFELPSGPPSSPGSSKQESSLVRTNSRASEPDASGNWLRESRQERETRLEREARAERAEREREELEARAEREREEREREREERQARADREREARERERYERDSRYEREREREPRYERESRLERERSREVPQMTRAGSASSIDSRTGVTASRITISRNRSHRPASGSSRDTRPQARDQDSEEIHKGDPSAMMLYGNEPSGSITPNGSVHDGYNGDGYSPAGRHKRGSSFSAAAALQQLRNEMGSAESNDGRDEYERANSGLPPNASRSNGRAASGGSGDLVQELIERNSRTTEELKDMQVMVDKQAAALKQKNGALAKAQSALAEAQQDKLVMEEELSVLRHQVEALSAAHRAAQLEAQQMAERNAAMARQISDLASAPSDGSAAPSATLQAQLDEQAGEIARLKHELEERRTTCEVLQRQVATNQVNTQMLEDQVAELEADKGKGAARLVDLQAEVAALKAQLAAGDKERAELEEALGFMEQSNQEQVAELRGELEQTRKALEAAAAKHAEEMAAQSEGEEMAYLQQQLRRSYQQVLSLQQQVSDLQAAQPAAPAPAAPAGVSSAEVAAQAADLAAAKKKASDAELAMAKERLMLQADLDQLLGEKEALVLDKERLTTEREELMNELVSTKLELAETREREIVIQRSLTKQGNSAGAGNGAMYR